LRLEFTKPDLTLPPPEIAGVPLEPGDSYDWEDIAFHPWSGNIFLMHEGTKKEIALYMGMVTPSDKLPESGAVGKAGLTSLLPGHIVNIKRMNLPGWAQTFDFSSMNNQGIEGIACSKDRLFAGMESPFEFSDRLLHDRSTYLAVWSINPDDPANMDGCKLLSVMDTSEWASKLGCTIETICGLSAIDNNHIVGIDRDNQKLFSITIDDLGKFVSGRAFYLDTPGPAPLPSDDCPDCDGLPKLLKPSLESVTVVPGPVDIEGNIDTYRIYLAVDPWGPGWATTSATWQCPKYEQRLKNLLPALYRYTVSADDLLK
jgi:hypothetical protein